MTLFVLYFFQMYRCQMSNVLPSNFLIQSFSHQHDLCHGGHVDKGTRNHSSRSVPSLRCLYHMSARYLQVSITYQQYRPPLHVSYCTRSVPSLRCLYHMSARYLQVSITPQQYSPPLHVSYCTRSVPSL